MSSDQALEALRGVDLDWTTHIKRVWQLPTYNVPEHNSMARDKLFSLANQLAETHDSPLGIPLIGQGGSGKTHLLTVLRHHAFNKGIRFILVDMTDVRDFWETIVQGYVSSLLEPEPDGVTQLEKIVEIIVGNHLPAEKIADIRVEKLSEFITRALSYLAKHQKQQTIQFQDCIRAIILANSNDFVVSAIGTNWLQGLSVEAEDRKMFGFTTSTPSHSEIAKGISWLMSLSGGSILALDQLDAIVTQHHIASQSGSDLTEEQQISQAIVHDIGSGLTNLRDRTSRTLVVLSCLESTWEILRSTIVSTFKDRYLSPIILGNIISADVGKRMVMSRLAPAYGRANYVPPYLSFPFKESFFENVKGLSPRNILQLCHKHRERCLTEDQVFELTDASVIINPGPSPRDFASLDQEFKEHQQHVDITSFNEKDSEDHELATFLEQLSNYLLIENPTANVVDAEIDKDFPGGKSFPLLHTRLRLVFRSEGDREKHLCFRGLQQTNAKAFQTRLKAAMTTSGIDRRLTFRKLVIVRTFDTPGGEKTAALLHDFNEADGVLWNPTQADLKAVLALKRMNHKPEFSEWLAVRRPLSQLLGIKSTIDWFFSTALADQPTTSSEISGQLNVQPLESFVAPQPAPQPDQRLDPVVDISRAEQQTSGPVEFDLEEIEPIKIDQLSEQLPLGQRLIGTQSKGAISIPLKDLVRHTVILAGSGSGKTVLIKRIIEEAALLGIPSIVIDGANDLARMGDSWPSTPTSSSDQDQFKADQYFQRTEVIVWTPGKESGNGLSLEPLPDFGAVASDSEELEQACDMARDALQEIVASGNSDGAKMKRGILKAALLYFAQNNPGKLEDFIELLSDLPIEAGGGLANAGKKASEMADLLRAEVLNNVLLKPIGSSLDPALLFGLESAAKTRISILNFIGLPSLGAQQQFLNQLAMTLFTWIKKHPAPVSAPIRGLLVIDEAKDFIPSSGSTVCKDSIIRLAAQARKYGLGLIFATQAPKSIDHNIIANCLTQFFGKASSPAAIQVVQDQIKQRGGQGDDIPKLKAGHFYVTSEGLAPTKLISPLCLSYHASTPLAESEVLVRATASKAHLQN